MHLFQYPRESLGRNLIRSSRWASGLTRGVILSMLLGLSLLTVVRATQGRTTEEQDDAPSPKMRIEEGEQIFHQRCAGCHTKAVGDTSPFGPPNLHGIFRGKSAITITEATTAIVKGKNSMPGWGNVLTRSEVSNVVAYLRTQ